MQEKVREKLLKKGSGQTQKGQRAENGNTELGPMGVEDEVTKSSAFPGEKEWKGKETPTTEGGVRKVK